MILLSILICHLPERKELYDRLRSILDPQLDKHFLEVEVLTDSSDRNKKSIGKKRNDLLALADGKYVAFIDDDDRISPGYINKVLEGCKKNVDCCSLRGIITEDGHNPLNFEHSIKYKEYKTNPEGMPIRYERYPNHLNAIRSDIAKQFKFPEINHGEDTDFATQVFKSGLIKTEHYIDQIIYFYDYRRNK